MATDPQEITALVGREVYSSNGVYVGQVEDIRIDFDADRVTGLAINQVNNDLFDEYLTDHRGIMVPYRWIQAVGDIIIVSDIVERLSAEQQQSQEDEAVA